MTKKKVIICIVTILIILIPFIYTNIKNNDVKTMLLGVMSSIIASLIFNVFSEAVFENRRDELNTLNRMISVLEEKETKGLLDIRGRSEFGTEFWIEFAEDTNKEWIISGRTLNRWLRNEIVDEFEKNVIRILKNKGRISFIIYKDLEGDEAKEKEILHQFLRKRIFPECVRKDGYEYIWKKNMDLKIYEVDKLPYLYNMNENEIIVAPYFTQIDNGNNIMFVLKRSSRYGEEYSRDFEYIIRNAEKNMWKEDYLSERNR